MKTNFFTIISLIAFLILSSCSNSTHNNSEKKNPFEGEPDQIIKVGNLEVNEGKMFISYEKGEYVLNIPVNLSQESSIDSKITIKINKLSGDAVEDLNRTLSEKISPETTELKLNLGKDYLPNTEELADLLMNYSIKWDSYDLNGKVSLFRISPRVKTNVLGSDKINKGKESVFRFFVNDVLSGNPIMSGDPIMQKDLSIKLYSDKNKENLVGEYTVKTDKTGMASLPISVDDSISGKLFMVVTTETAYGVRSVETEVNVVHVAKILLTTDKPVYQPTQTIHIRTLSLETPSKLPLMDKEITLEITDPLGNKVFRKKGSTSDFGVFAVDFTLADLVTLGKYTIDAVIDGEFSSSKTVTVEKYVLPKFGVEFRSDKPFYMPGDTVKGSVAANYFYGKPVSGGTLHVEVKTFDVSENTVATIDATLSKDGTYDFETVLPAYFTGSELEQGKAAVKFELTVTDTADHAQSTVKTIKVVKAPVIANLVPAAGKILPGSEQDFYLIVADPNGLPLSAAATVSSKNFTENIDVSKSGIAEFKQIIAPDEEIIVAVKYDGKTFESSFTFQKGDESEFVFLSTDSAIYDAGDKMAVNIFTGFDPESPQPSMLPDRAYLDIIAEGQIQLMKTVPFKEGKGSFEITLDETLQGPLELLAYYLTKEGNIIRSSKAVYVRKASTLNVEFTTDKDEYKPRELARASFKVTTPDKKPVVAAIGVAMVDEAVFHVMDFTPGMEKTYFELESAVMESTYAIYGTSYSEITTPVEDKEKAEEVDKRADAYFAGNASDLSHGVATEDYSPIEKNYLSASKKAVKDKAEAIFNEIMIKSSNCVSDALTDKELYKILNNSKYTDPWDNIMSGTVVDESYYAKVRLISAGPDEFAGTKDDITVEIVYCEVASNDSEIADAEAGAGSSGDSGDWDNDSGSGESKKKVKVREWFPETLYYNPQLITDELGIADFEITMADSITTWRVTALANSLAGEIGSSLDGVRVFQDFFVDIDFPVFLTQNDEVAVPVGIYNYLNTSQKIVLEADSQEWFEMTGASSIQVTVPANSVSAAYFPIKVKKIGKHSLTVYAYGSVMSDAIKRTVTVKPDGIMQDKSVSGLLDSSKSVKLVIPSNAIEESAELFVKIYPGIMSQGVEGLDSMLQMPYGCFEQTSSATYPNILVLQYMINTNTLTPEIELKARDLITQGYQRLLTFEVKGGGFEWFGDEPAHFVLTSYGLLEFVDMSTVHEIDKAIIDRTAAWMASKQNSDGSFEPTSGGIPEGAINNFQNSLLRTTAYGTWALARAEKEKSARATAVNYLESNASKAEDTYTKAMVGIALTANNGSSTTIDKLISDILDDKTDDGEDGIYWKQSLKTETYSSGDGANLETTALIGLLLIERGGFQNTVDKILNWIVRQKDSFGNWSTTQGTILALRFMIASLGNETSETDATVKVSANSSPETTIVITPEDSDILRLIDFKEHLNYGENNIEIKFTGTGSMMYQATATWYVPGQDDSSKGPLTIDVIYDKMELSVNDIVGVKVKIKNVSVEGVAMVLASIGIAPGFSLIPSQLDDAVENGELQNYESTPRQLILYINYLAPGDTKTVNFELMADYPMEGATGESSVNPYYNPEQKHNDHSQTLMVTE
ncbi:MAG: MG2 domain-containing protein [bacterium]